MRVFAAATVLLCIVLQFCPRAVFAQTPNVDAKIQDGIIAAVAVKDRRAVLGWRFIRRIEATIDKTAVTIDGTDLGDPPVQGYPAPGDTTSIVALLDIGDPRRVEQIQRGKLAMLLMRESALPHHRLAFAIYGLEGNLLSPAEDTPQSMTNLLMQVRPINEPSNLSGAIVHSIRTLEKLQTSRRAIFVLTDGHNDGSIDLAAVRDLAVTTGVVVNILLFPGDRPANLDVLEQTVVATGGQMVRPEALVTFLASPFLAIDSGGTQTFPFDAANRFFWQSASGVKAVIQYGVKKIELAVPAHAAVARPQQTAEYLLHNHPLAVAGSTGAVIALAVLAFLGLRRRQSAPAIEPVALTSELSVLPGTPPPMNRPEPPVVTAVLGAADHADVPDPEPVAILAVLQNIDDGSAHAITSPLANIGRATTNEIVVDDATVSRRHAVMQQQGFGAFTIENLSGNGTYVNHQKIDKSPLVDGDLITMGSTTFRYAQGEANAKTPAS